jgi:hypothetical protein
MVDPLGDPDRLSTGGGHAEVDGLDGRAPPVVERGVGNREPGDPGHHGLEFEDRLQDALGHFGLVGRIRGHEFGPAGQGTGHRRDLVVVGTAAGEADHPVRSRPVPVREGLHAVEDIGLADAVGQLEGVLQFDGLRDSCEQLVE